MYLVSDLKVREEWDVSSPLDGAEEKARCQLTNVLNAHDVVRCRLLHAMRRPTAAGRGRADRTPRRRRVSTCMHQ